MNAAIASASLLGFGDKPASEAMSSFAQTLEKIYNSQSATSKKEEKSRADTIAKYNEQERDKKKKKSDFEDFLKKMKGDKEGEGEGEKKKKKGGIGLLGILGITAIGGAALTAFAPMIIGKLSEMLFSSMKDKLEKMVEEIVDAIEAPIKEKFEEIKEGWNGIVGFVKKTLGLEEEEEEEGGEEKEPTPAEAVAEAVTPAPPAPNKQGSTPAAQVSEAVKQSAPEEGGNTEWAPVLDMIADAESEGRYDVLVGGEVIDGITEMTIVEAAKKAGDEGGGKNLAVGKYQFTTLVKQAEAAGLNPEEDKFSPANQDKIAINLIKKKRGVTKNMVKNNPNEAAKRLAMEWAGLPVLESTKGEKKDIERGQSYYAGDGVNKSTISPEQVEGSFQKLQRGGEVKTQTLKGRDKPKVRPGNGPPSEEKVLPQGVQKKVKGGKIFLHWAGSGYSGAHPNYHATVQGDGSVEKTKDYNSKGGAHTYLRNNQGIGLSLAAMKGATDTNFGSYPVKPVQYTGLAKLIADIAGERGWKESDITVQNVMTHAEAAAGKDGQLPGNDNYGPVPWGGDGARWDLWKLYQNDMEGSGGQRLRGMVRSHMSSNTGTTEETTTETTTTVPQAVAGGARGQAPPPMTTPPTKEQETETEEKEEKSGVKGVEAVLKAAEDNVGLGAGQSMQCANTTRQVLRSAGHPDANKITSKGDLDPQGLKYSGASFAASFAGTDMGNIKESKSALVPGDIVLWKNTFNAMGGNEPGAITHVGIKGRGADVYDHGSGPGWRKRSMWDGGKFAYGVTLPGTGNATGDGPSFDSNSVGVTGPESNSSTGGGIDGIIDGIINEALAPILGVLAKIAGATLFGGSPAQAATLDSAPNYLSDGGGGGGTPSMTGGMGAASTSDPNARALLNAIADAEGTVKYTNNGYNTMFTGKQFESMEDHPRQLQGSGSLKSDAAGRYQFLSTTWDEYAKGRDMSPANQDAVALELVAKKRGVDISDGLSKDEIYKLGQEWASIEGGASGVPGGSYGTQAKFSADKFMSMYEGYGGKPQTLQQGGTVGGQINTGTMRGVQNTNMSKLKEMSAQMKKVGPKVIRVQAPPVEVPPAMTGGGGGEGTPVTTGSMSMSELSDYMSRVSMGALA